ncbi:MAG TPA: hypothetical protein VE820_12100, partial [Sphingomicrobium sp.]|nr:hypothetical protein [Sphingomicrobium sp.]
MKPSTGTAVRLHRIAVRDRPESLSAFKWNACPPSPEYAAWKQTAEAARAITAAMPLLERSSRIVVLSAAEDPHSAERTQNSAAALQKQLLWHGFTVETRFSS